MKLDRNKRYEGFGLTFRRTCFDSWLGEDLSAEKKPQATVYDSVMQRWLDAGHIKPVRETKIVRVSGVVMCVDDYGNPYVDHCTMAQREVIALGLTGKVSKPVTLEFEVEA